MKHAVITGPTGAIGVALIEKLIQEGFESLQSADQIGENKRASKE